MALTAADTTYLSELYDLRSKLTTGKVVKNTSVGGQDRIFADPPPLAYVIKEIARLEEKSAEIPGRRRLSTTVKSDTW